MLKAMSLKRPSPKEPPLSENLNRGRRATLTGAEQFDVQILQVSEQKSHDLKPPLNHPRLE